MNNKFYYMYLLFISLVLNSCVSTSDNCGSRNGLSKTLTESKANGTFIASYTANTDYVKNPVDSVPLRIKEIYREYQFTYDNDWKIVPKKSSQIIIKFHDNVPDSYYIDWIIGNYDEAYFTSGIDYISSELDKIDEFDTLQFVVTEGRYSQTPYKPIDKLILYRK